MNNNNRTNDQDAIASPLICLPCNVLNRIPDCVLNGHIDVIHRLGSRPDVRLGRLATKRLGCQQLNQEMLLLYQVMPLRICELDALSRLSRRMTPEQLGAVRKLHFCLTSGKKSDKTKAKDRVEVRNVSVKDLFPNLERVVVQYSTEGREAGWCKRERDRVEKWVGVGTGVSLRFQ